MISFSSQTGDLLIALLFKELASVKYCHLFYTSVLIPLPAFGFVLEYSKVYARPGNYGNYYCIFK